MWTFDFNPITFELPLGILTNLRVPNSIANEQADAGRGARGVPTLMTERFSDRSSLYVVALQLLPQL